jgi:hypothetical protein
LHSEVILEIAAERDSPDRNVIKERSLDMTAIKERNLSLVAAEESRDPAS